MKTTPLPAIFRSQGEGHRVPGPEGNTLKATGKETGGSIGFFEATSEPGFGPPPHIHHSADELFYVLEGAFEFRLGEQLFRADPGAFVFIPRGTVHAPLCLGPAPGRIVAAFVPGGQEQSFEEFSRLAASHNGEPPPEELARIARKYDSEFIVPGA